MSTIPKDLEQVLQQTQESLTQTEQQLHQTQKKFQELTEAVNKYFAEIETSATIKTPSTWQNILGKTGNVIGAASVPLSKLLAATNPINQPVTTVSTNFEVKDVPRDIKIKDAPSNEVKKPEIKDSEEIKPALAMVDIPNMLVNAKQVIIIPGYGMAVAQAQHKVLELAKALGEWDVQVKFAINPVAGRMPGHMDVLLAEAGVPYAMIFDLEGINTEFEQTDVALAIGANDVINPAARTDSTSPIYRMPILNADKAKNIIAIKRGQGTGFAGIENHLFHANNTYMLHGDGQKVVGELLEQIKSL